MITSKICSVCGISFKGGPRAKYCTACREDKKKESQHKHRRMGTMRELGSIDKCTVCGKEYVVKSSNQRYCEECSKPAVAKVRQYQSLKWYKDNSERVNEKRKDRCSGAKNCIICGKEFASRTKANTCSHECWKINKNNIWRENYHKRKSK